MVNLNLVIGQNCKRVGLTMESDPCPEEGEKILAEAENILAPGLLGVWSL